MTSKCRSAHCHTIHSLQQHRRRCRCQIPSVISCSAPLRPLADRIPGLRQLPRLGAVAGNCRRSRRQSRGSYQPCIPGCLQNLHLACSGCAPAASPPPNAAAADVRRPAYSAPRSPISPRSRLGTEAGCTVSSTRGSASAAGFWCSQWQAKNRLSVPRLHKRQEPVCRLLAQTSTPAPQPHLWQANTHPLSSLQVITWHQGLHRPARHRCPRARAPRQMRRPPGPGLRAGSRSVMTCN